MKELLQLLQEVEREIQVLRHTNQILQAKVSTMELMGRIFDATPNYPLTGEMEDVAWKLRKKYEEIANDLVGNNPKPPVNAEAVARGEEAPLYESSDISVKPL